MRYDRLNEMVVEVTPQPSRSPKIAVFSGTKLATSTQLSARVLDLIGDPGKWHTLPPETRDWLELQREISVLPQPGTLTCESFQHAGRAFFCAYSFAGRNANQTLGLLLTRRMEEAGLGPLGFVATDYALLIWSMDPVTDPAPSGARQPARGAGGLAGGKRGDEAQLSQRGDGGGAVAAQPAGAAQIGRQGDVFQRHHL